jgi:hypothetical protein
MKKLIYLVSLTTLGIFLIFLYAGCSEESPVATTVPTTQPTTQLTTATVTGTGSLPPGVAGSIANTRVALYTDLNNWNFDVTFKFGACDANGNYTLADFNPGNYFMDAWKDNDNNSVWGSSGDYVWVFGSGSYPNYTLSEKSFTLGSNSQNFEIFLVP